MQFVVCWRRVFCLKLITILQHAMLSQFFLMLQTTERFWCWARKRGKTKHQQEHWPSKNACSFPTFTKLLVTGTVCVVVLDFVGGHHIFLISATSITSFWKVDDIFAGHIFFHRHSFGVQSRPQVFRYPTEFLWGSATRRSNQGNRCQRGRKPRQVIRYNFFTEELHCDHY